VAAAVQTAVLLAEHTAGGMAMATLVTMAALTIGQGLVAVGRERSTGGLLIAIRRRTSQPATIAVLACTAVGLTVRLITFRGIWLDEATSIRQARMHFAGMIGNLYQTDVHPPLYFALLWTTVRVFHSYSEFVLRVPSVVCGTAIIPVTYFAARDLFDRRTAIVATVLSVFAPLMVWYSQEIRMYAQFMLLGLLAMWGQVMAYRTGRRPYWAVWAVSSGLLAWTEYFGLLQVLSQQLMFLWVLWKDRWTDGFQRLMRKWLGWSLVMATIILPVMPFAYHQFIVNQQAGKGFHLAPSQAGTATLGIRNRYGVYALLANLIWAGWGYQPNATMTELGALWPLGMLMALLLLGRRPGRNVGLLAMGFAGPVLILTGLAYFKHFLLDVRYVSGAVPLVVLAAARLITATSRRMLPVAAVTTVVTASLAVALVNEQTNSSNPRHYAFHSALTRIVGAYRPGDVIAYAPSDIGGVVRYYAPTEDVVQVSRAAPPPMGHQHEVFVVLSRRLTSPAALSSFYKEQLPAIERAGFVLEKFSVPNVKVWEVEVTRRMGPGNVPTPVPRRPAGVR
nr:glycosyltransferase family 39 protein [Actinomycetota bacterium]